MLDIIIQVILAIFLLLIMAFIAYSIYDKEYINSIKLSNTNKNETLILNGIYSFNKGAGKVETFNKIDPNYFDLSPSVNQNGGAEYSYNFWVYYNIRDNGSKEIITGEGKKYIILFYKGDLNILPYNQSGYSRDTDGLKKYLIVKNPLVKISNDGADIIVVDSISALLPAIYFEKDGNELKDLQDTKQIGAEAKDMTHAVKMLNYANKNTLLILISQQRNQFGSMHASHIPTGGIVSGSSIWSFLITKPRVR